LLDDCCQADEKIGKAAETDMPRRYEKLKISKYQDEL
jgi:hypothetical protein